MEKDTRSNGDKSKSEESKAEIKDEFLTVKVISV